MGFPLVVTTALQPQLTGAPLRRLLLLRCWLQGEQARQLWATRFSCSEACGIFPDQGLNLWLLHWQADSLSRATREVLSYVFDTYAYTVYLFISSVKVCHLGGLCLAGSPRCIHFVSHYQ